MLLMALVVLAALVAVIVLSLWFIGRAAAQRAAAAREVRELVGRIQKQAREADQGLAQAILSGTGVDPAIANFQKARAALIPAGRAEDPWAWMADDLTAYQAAELRRRSDEIGRRLLLPAVTAILVVVLATAAALALLYQYAGPRPDSAPTDIPTALPAPGPGSSDPANGGPALPVPTPPTDPSN